MTPGQLCMYNALPPGPTTCVNIAKLEFFLKSHPDKIKVRYVIEGLKHGFDIGFLRGELRDAAKNNKSALNNKQQVSKAIKKGLENERYVDLFYPNHFQTRMCRPLERRINQMAQLESF